MELAVSLCPDFIFDFFEAVYSMLILQVGFLFSIRDTFLFFVFVFTPAPYITTYQIALSHKICFLNTHTSVSTDSQRDTIQWLDGGAFSIVGFLLALAGWITLLFAWVGLGWFGLIVLRLHMARLGWDGIGILF